MNFIIDHVDYTLILLLGQPSGEKLSASVLLSSLKDDQLLPVFLSWQPACRKACYLTLPHPYIESAGDSIN